MSSFFSQASFVMDPSVYRAGTLFVPKPTDGSGDLNVTRSNDTATRVGPDGYIEKVRTNLVLQSQTFQTTWLAINASVSVDDTIAPDGTLTADKLVENSVATTQHRIDQTSVSASGSNTFSVYAKKSERDRIFMRIGISGATFDLTNGTITQISAGFIATITDAGNGWYRCTTSTATALSNEILRINLVDAAGAFTYSGDGVSGAFIWGAQYETGDIATDYIATTSAAVSVGPVANVPRLDYLGSSCPRLLLEPQRTNLVTFSEYYGSYTKFGSSVTENTETSPEGVVNASTFAGNGSQTQVFLSTPITFASSGAATISVFAKEGTHNFFELGYDGFSTSSLNVGVYNLTAGTATGTGADIEDYGNGWYRCILTQTIDAGDLVGAMAMRVRPEGSFLWPSSGAANGKSVFVYGAQVEAGSYPTSYIPTYGAAVTRGVDSASKTGIASLIGQTEGTLYWEGRTVEGVGTDLFIVGNLINSVFFNITSSNSLRIGIRVGNALLLGPTGGTVATNNKIALAYKSGDIVAYLNGVQVITNSSSFTFSDSMSEIEIAKPFFDGKESQLTSQALVFKTRLSNADLAALTA